MTRLWIPAQPITMQLTNDLPGTFEWHKRNHHVSYVALHWRLDLTWWKDHIWRDYYKLTTHTGLLVVIYEDLLAGDWYLQQLYD